MAAVTAAGSSACCWVPLLLVGMGVSTAGVSGFFETLRPYLIALTAGLLLAGFSFLYLRSPRSDLGPAAAVAARRSRRSRRATYWCGAALCVGFLFFPQYGMPLLVGESTASLTAIDASTQLREYQVSGMTCEGCATGLQARLDALPGVQVAEVDYPGEVARLWMDGPAAEAPLMREFAEAGFGAERVP